VLTPAVTRYMLLDKSVLQTSMRFKSLGDLSQAAVEESVEKDFHFALLLLASEKVVTVSLRR
jgi:hypothetical protein